MIELGDFSLKIDLIQSNLQILLITITLLFEKTYQYLVYTLIHLINNIFPSLNQNIIYYNLSMLYEFNPKH